MFKFFARSKAAKNPGRAALERYFLDRGWETHAIYAGGFMFIVQKKDAQGAVIRAAIKFGSNNQNDLHDLCGEFRASTYGMIANEDHCTCVILFEALPPNEVRTLALEACVLLITFDDLDHFELRLHELQRKIRDRYHFAKHKLLRLEDASDGEVPAEAEAGLLYRSKYTQCRLFERDAGLLLVTFADRHDRPETLIGASAAAALNASLLCIQSGGPNWYPLHDAEKWLKAVAGVLGQRYPRRVGFGTGQGGYGVLKYGARLGCGQVIAISPCYSIDPWDIEDGRYTEYFRDELHYDMRLKAGEPAGDILLVYDPQDAKDQRNAKAILNLSAARQTFLPFAGPATAWLFGGNEILPEFLGACITGDWPRVRLLCAQARHRNPDRAFNMAFSLAERKPEIACRIFEKYSPGQVSRWASVCFLLAKAGQAARVIGPMEGEVERAPDNFDLRICTALIALELRDPAKALTYLEPALEAEPNDLKLNWMRNVATDMIKGV